MRESNPILKMSRGLKEVTRILEKLIESEKNPRKYKRIRDNSDIIPDNPTEYPGECEKNRKGHERIQPNS